MILNVLIDRVSSSNPQIFRELKERLTPKNIAIAIAGAITIQLLVLLYFNGQIPVPTYETYPVRKLISQSSPYCGFPDVGSNSYYSNLCKINELGSFDINWQKWWLSVFGCMSLLLPLGLILGSVYMLVADLIREEKRGTLNFIRISPQTTNKIFSGKIFGVPILVYLATILLVPFHLWAGFNAEADLSLMASWYAAVVSIWFLLASASGLYVLLGGVQAIVTTMVVSYPVGLFLVLIYGYILKELDRGKNYTIVDNLSWFGLPVTSNAIWFNGFVAVCCAIATSAIWQALDRRYLNPSATVISKPQSYLFTLCFQIIVAGFVIPLLCQFDKNIHARWSTISAFAAIDFLVLLVSIPMLLPNKQTLQDWSRYRRESTQHRKFWQRDLFKDLITNDKSPALLAIAINEGIALLLWIPVAIAVAKISKALPIPLGLKLLGCAGLAASLILIYATIAHLGLFLKVKKRNVWTISIVTGVAILPLVIAYVLSPFKTPTGFGAFVLLFSPFAPVAITSLSAGTIFTAFASQLAMFGLLARRLQRKLQISGRSQTKELLAHN